MMNVSGGRLLLFVTQLTDGRNLTFSILYVALNKKIIIHYRICDDMRHPAPRVRQPTPHTGWVDAMWVSL